MEARGEARSARGRGPTVGRAGPRELAGRLGEASARAGGDALAPALLEAIGAEAAARGSLTPDLPGLVYERGRAADRAHRRAAAVYYTPPHLVDFTVERALEPTLRERDPRDPPVRVLDPSCGGGAFALAA